MQVPTHLVVHCSALADLGCLIRSCFPSPPAHRLLVSHAYATHAQKVAKHICTHERTHRRAWAGRWTRCPPGAPASTGWPREPAPPRPAPPAPTSPGPYGWLCGLGSRSGDAPGRRWHMHRTRERAPWPRGVQVESCGLWPPASHPDQPRWLPNHEHYTSGPTTGEEDTMGPLAPGLGRIFTRSAAPSPALAFH